MTETCAQADVALAILLNGSDHRFTGAPMTILAAQLTLLAI
jgi:hypothetical protein